MAQASELDWGLLWFDDDPIKSFRQKVLEAATQHRRKFGIWPDLCHVHPDMLKNGRGTLVSSIYVIGLKTVQRHHFWIGIAKEKDDNSTQIAEDS